jgi:oligopeptidase B
MDRRTLLLTGTAAMAVGIAGCATTPGAAPASGRARFTALAGPAAERRPVTITQLGRVRTDDYQWMRAAHWQEVIDSPTTLPAEIRTHIEAENAYTEEVLMAPTAALRDKLFQELRGRIDEDDSSVPAPDGIFEYAVRFREGGQYPIVVRRPIDRVTKAPTGPEQVVLDGNVEAEGHAFWRLQGWAHSPDHSLVGYAVDYRGGNSATLRFRDTTTGRDLPYEIQEIAGPPDWAPDSKTCFYQAVDANFRPSRVMRHTVGAAGRDTLVFEERDPAFQMGIGTSASGEYLFIVRAESASSEVLYIPMATPDAAPRRIAPHRPGVEYYPEHFGGHFFLRTNAGGALDYRIARVPVGAPETAAWEDVIPHQPGRFIGSMEMYGRYMVLDLMVDALPQFSIRDMASAQDHLVSFPEEAYDLSIARGFEFDTTTLRFTYSSPTTPAEVWDYDMATRERVLRKRQRIPSGHDAADYVTRRIVAVAPDGARVPVTLLARRTTPLDGTAPCLLYGYGAYGISMPASFSIGRLPLVDRGLVYAIAHVRGGQERGRQWYLDGKLMQKRNSFTDLIAVAAHLEDARIVAPGRTVIEGRSAGGLLVGATMNMAPTRFAGVIAGVAFVDVINTISDASLPLTPPEWTEWGNPITDPAAYDYMMSYSPYENVAEHTYPPVLAQTALSDSQVTYWEPTKWVAQLRARAPQGGPYLLRCNMEAGHGGASGRFDRLKEVAESHAFALWCLGMTA